MRLTLDWTMAIRLPTVMVSTARIDSMVPQAMVPSGMTRVTTRASTAKAAALVPVDMKAVTGVGAPW